MPAVADWLSLNAGAFVNALGLLLDSALKGIVLVGAAGVASYFLRSRSAAARHAAWTAAVIGHLALPAVTLFAPAWRLPFLPAPPWLTASVSTEVYAAPPPTQTQTPTVSSPSNAVVNSAPARQPASAGMVRRVGEPVSPGAAQSEARAENSSQRALPWLGVLWILGSAAVLLRLALGTVRVNKLAREGSRVTDGAWLSLAQRVAGRLGISRPFLLLHGERLGIPVTWGIVYPAVLLPPDSDEWPEARRRFVLVHEMAHVKRFDALTQLAAQIAVAVFWFDPFIWLAAHRMRVEREHACDDYVLRDGTTPSLYAGELLEMVRSLGTPEHERAAPAFAALAMARRSEFEGRMLAILDPKLDRHDIDRRSTMMTIALVAVLVLPLAALRPFEQPGQHAGAVAETSSRVAAATSTPRKTESVRSCDSIDLDSPKSTTTHISVHDDSGTPRSISFLMSRRGRCTEATMLGRARLSADESRVVALPEAGLATFREVVPGEDRSVVIAPAPNGGLSYTAHFNGRLVSFDSAMQSWLARFLPEVLRESAVDVPQRVARLRGAGGVTGVLDDIARIRSSAAKTAHYVALLDLGSFTQAEIDRIARSAGRDLAPVPSDLRTVLDHMSAGTGLRGATATGRVQGPGAHASPVSPSPAARADINQSMQSAIDKTVSSGDKAAILSQYAATDDPDALLMVLRGARELSSDGDKSSLLQTVAPKALSAKNEALRAAFFSAVATLTSDGEARNVLIAALPYGHADEAVTGAIIRGVGNIHSPGDQAAVLIAMAQQRLLTSQSSRDAFLKAAKQIPSSGDQARVLDALIR